MSGPLCEAVLEQSGSAVTLTELARSNMLLVPLDRRGEWYRYHHLFRDINRYNKVFIERNGKLSETQVRFKDDAHLLHIIEKIVSQVGRRIDEAQPIVTRAC